MGSVHAKTVEQDSEVSSRGKTKPSPLDACSVQVQRIHINGLNHTRDDIASHQVQSVFDASNFLQLIREVNSAKSRLLRIGCFRDVEVFIDTCDEGVDKYEVYFRVDEVKRYAGGISSQIGTNSGALLVSGRMQNVLGRGQRLQTEYHYGSNKSVGVHTSYAQPLLFDPNIRLSMGGGQMSSDNPWSNFRQTDRGVHADLTFPVPGGGCELKYSGVWRELDALTKFTSFAVREQCGHSFKSALSAAWMRDSRDNPILPSRGHLIKITNELAGLGGDVGYLKSQLDGQLNVSLPFDMSLQFSGSAGQLMSLPGMLNNGKSVKICDRFFIGGPLSVRGFETRGIGPRAEGDALGGTAMLQCAAHLYTPLPLRKNTRFSDQFRLHAFASAGNTEYTYLNMLRPTDILRLACSARYSVGAGVAMQLGGIARIELNYCVPRGSQPGERPQHGFQFGIGIEYL